MWGFPLRCFAAASLLLVHACSGLNQSPVFDGSLGLEPQQQQQHRQRNLLQISHLESGTLEDGAGHDHPHVHEEDDGSLPVVYQHDPSELPVDHLIEVFGGNGILYESELDALIHVLNVECGVSANPHTHQYHHEHVTSSGGEKEIMTASYLTDHYGDNGVLTSDGLLNACPDILRCQLDDDCVLTETMASDKRENVDQLKLLAASIFLVEAVIGTILPMILGAGSNYKMWLTVLNCFSGGVFLAAGFIHMIPQILENESKVEGLNGYPLGSLMIVIGFVLVLLVEHVILNVHVATNKLFSTTAERSKEMAVVPQFHHISQPRQNLRAQPEQTPKEKQSTMSHAGVILMAISVHALLESLALGLEERKNGVLLLLATIGSHKGVASMALSARFVQSGASRKQIFIFMGLFAVIAPIGVGIGLATDGVGPLTLVLLDSLAAGSFIYVGAYEVISEEFPHQSLNPSEEETPRMIRAGKFMSIISGILVIALLQLIPHE